MNHDLLRDRPRNIRALFFDFDGVLVDSDPLWWAIIENVLNDLGLSTDTLTARPSGLRLEEALREASGACKANTDLLALAAREVRKRAESIIPHQPLAPDAARAIDVFYHAGIVMGIVSASHTALLKKFIALNRMSREIPIVVGGDRVTRTKPAPDGYRLALREGKARPGEACAVEDSDIGLLAAWRAGIWAVHFLRRDPRTESAGCPPHVTVRSVSELVSLIM